MNLKQKLIEIRKEVDYLKKDAKGYNYSYVKEEDILASIKGKMNELNVLLEPHIKNHSLQEFKYLTKKGDPVTESIVAGDLVFVWVDAESDEERPISWALYGQNRDASQAFGSGLTYSNRYFLLKYFNVATSKDDPDEWRQKQNEKEDADYAKSLKRIKDNLPDKMLIEANNNEPIRKKATLATLKDLDFKNWDEFDLNVVSDKVFMAKYKTWVKHFEDLAKQEIER